MTPALPALDPWQYRLLPARAPGATGRALGDFRLETGPGLPVVAVADRHGRPTGLLLGFGLDLAARRPLGSCWTAPAGFDPAAPDAYAEAVLRAVGGDLLFILAAGGQPRLYPDIAAQVPCVFDARSGAAGATAAALLAADDYAARLDRALYRRLGLDGEGWFPAGLTAHRGLQRLLPGHVLDLDRGRITRFWPRAAIPPCPDPDAVVTESIALIQAQLEALLAGPQRVAMALTGGRDSRLMLACARPYLDRIDCVTVTGGDRHGRDTVLARQIARTFGLRHIELPRVTATPEQRALFIHRGGHCNADSNSYFHPSVWPIAASHVFVGGLGGEYGRAFLWRGGDTAATPVTAQVLRRRLGLAEAPPLDAALQGWLDGLPPLDAFGILDLAYAENRMAAWGSAQFCCDPTLVRQNPMLTWHGIELMFSLPPALKRTPWLATQIIARGWPELARIPFNTLGPWQDRWRKLHRVFADPRVVIKKLRKLRG